MGLWGYVGVGWGGWGGVGVLTFCRVRTVHVATLPCGGYVGVGGVGWGGGVNVLSSAYSTCCDAAMWGVGVLTFCRVRTVHVATLPCGGYVRVGWGGVVVLTFCRVRTVHVATLPKSLECLPRYMLLRCRDLWNACHVTCCYARDLLWYPCYVTCCYARDLLWYPCYVTCCYAAEISCGILATLHVATPEISCGILATLHVATLQRSPVVSLLRYMLLRCRDLLWYPCYVTCCYAAEISCGILATLHVATLQGSPVVSLLRYMLLSCIDITKLIVRCTNI